MLIKKGTGMSKRRHELSDEQWDRIKDLLPGQPGKRGDNGKDNRLFLNAVFWIAKTGAPWRDLPERLGDWKNTHRRFSRWAKAGVWEKVFKALNADADFEYLMIDSTVNRVHQHAAGAEKRGVLNHLAALGEDFPQKFMQQ